VSGAAFYNTACGGLFLTVASLTISSHKSANNIPAAAAPCGIRLVSVMPGNVFTSRQ
jgi:hypothetical protein